MTGMEDKAVKHFIKVLQSMPPGESGRKHHLKLFNTLLDSKEKSLQEYFKTFNESKKYKFFSQRSEFFSMKKGYVSLKPLLKNKVPKCEKLNKPKLPVTQNIHSLPSDVGPSAEPVEVCSAAKPDAEKKIIQFFINLLQKCGESHYLKLAYHLQSSILPEKIHFYHLEDVEKLYFFKLHEDFVVEADGFVSLPGSLSSAYKSIDEKAVQLAEVYLSFNNEMHFEKLIAEIQNCSLEMINFFGSLTTAEKLRFFKSYPLHFCVKKTGYVTSAFNSGKHNSPASQQRSNSKLDDLEQNEIVTRHLVSQLQMSGTVHFQKLAESLDTDLCTFKGILSSMPTLDLFHFFHKHSRFHIRDDGYVILLDDKKCQVTVDDSETQISPSNNVTVSSDAINPTVKSQCSSYVEVSISETTTSSVKETLGDNLLCCEEIIQAPDSSTQSSNLCSSDLSGDQTSALSTFSGELDTSLELSEQLLAVSEASEPNKQLSEFESDVLKRLCKSETLPYCSAVLTLSIIMHYMALHLISQPLKLTKLVKFLNPSHPNILKLFRGFNVSHVSQCFIGHKQFHFADDGVVSVVADVSHNFPEAVVVVKAVLLIVIQTLKDCYSVHYGKLIKHVAKCSPEAKSYFSHFSESGKYWFLKNHPLYFVVSIDGFVSLAENNSVFFLRDCVGTSESFWHHLNADQESEILKFFMTCLKSSNMSSETLVDNFIKSDTEVIKHICAGKPYSDIHAFVLAFFKERPSAFSIHSDGSVSLCGGEKKNDASISTLSSNSKNIEASDSVCHNSSSSLVAGDCSHLSAMDSNCVGKSTLNSEVPTDSNSFNTSLEDHINSNEKKNMEASDTVYHSASNSIVAADCSAIASVSSNYAPKSTSNNSVSIESSNSFNNSLEKHNSNIGKNMIRTSGTVHCSASNSLVAGSALAAVGSNRVRKDTVNSLVSSSSSSSCNTSVKNPNDRSKKENVIIGILTSHLKSQSSLHFEKLCRVSAQTVDFFKDFTVSEQFKFFKESSPFVIGGDGFVKLLGSVSSYKSVLATKDIEQNLVKLFVKLTTNKKRTFVGLRMCAIACVKTWNNASGNMLHKVLLESSNDDIYQFLKSRPQYFTINGNNVSANLPEKAKSVKQNQLKIVPLSHSTVIPENHHSSSTVNKSSQLCETRTCLPEHLNENSDSGLKRCSSRNSDSSLDTKQCSYNHAIVNNDIKANNCKTEKCLAYNPITASMHCPTKSSSSIATACDKLNSKHKTPDSVVEYIGNFHPLNFLPMHIYSIRYCVNVLIMQKALHYKLLLNILKENPEIASFYSYFIDDDILYFFKIHSMYFNVSDIHVVSLKNPEINPNSILTLYEDLLAVYQAIEDEAVKFFKNILSDGREVSETELRSLVNYSPGYVRLFFRANYISIPFICFFVKHHNFFLITKEGRVILRTDVADQNPCNNISAATHDSKHVQGVIEKVAKSGAQEANAGIQKGYKNGPASSDSGLCLLRGVEKKILKIINDILKSRKCKMKYYGLFDFALAYAKNAVDRMGAEVYSALKSISEQEFLAFIASLPQYYTITKNYVELNIENTATMPKEKLKSNLGTPSSIDVQASNSEVEQISAQIAVDSEKIGGSEICNGDVEEALNCIAKDNWRGDKTQRQDSTFQNCADGRPSTQLMQDNPLTAASKPKKNEVTVANCGKFTDQALPLTSRELANSFISSEGSPLVFANKDLEVAAKLNTSGEQNLTNQSSGTHFGKRCPLHYHEVLCDYLNSKPCGVFPTTVHGGARPLGNPVQHLSEASAMLESAGCRLVDHLGTLPEVDAATNGHSYFTKLLTTALLPFAQRFDAALERKCVQFFVQILQRNINPLPVQGLLAHVSEAPSDIQSYLIKNYVCFDLSLFFYLHMDHFVISSEKYISLQLE